MGTLRICCCAAALLLTATPAFAQSEARATELQVKAAFLYKFGAFIEWPAEAFPGPDGAFVIGVLGADSLADELERLVTGRTVQERTVVVRRLRDANAFGRLHVLFVGHTENARLRDVLASARGQPVLTVTESENALSRGSMINFVVAEDRVRFDVALPPAEDGNLKISARLLTVARRVVASPL